MKKIHFSWLIMSICFSVHLISLPEVYAGWESISSGFEYQKFITPESTNVYVMRMSLDTIIPYRTIDSCIAQGQFYKVGLPYGGRESVSSMVKRYDDTVNAYKQVWGRRTQIIAAINGDYWERQYYPNGLFTGRPQSGQVVSGWFARRFNEFTGGSGFYFTMSGVPHIGGDVRNGTTDECRQKIIFADTSSADLTGINVERNLADLILYTPQWGASTQTDNSGIEVLVKIDRPNLPLSYSTLATSCNGTIVEIRNNQGNTMIPFDHVVISGTGLRANVLRNKCAVGKNISLQMYIRDYGFPSNIRVPAHPPQDWTKTYGAIGCDREILIDSQITNLPKPDNVKRARTAIALNKLYVYFVVVEETIQKGTSGMTLMELAAFCKQSLSATHACSIDGGGSSCLWIRGKGIVNKPSDGQERATCNGLLMVAIQEKQQSTKYKVNQKVSTKNTTELRLGPGNNYYTIATVAQLQTGTIINHTLNGISATGQSWWYTQFGNITGWCSESSLQ
jgi:hypothetical protein